MDLGDYVKLIVLCAVLLPIIGGFLLSRNSKWSQGAGKFISGIGIVAAALLALLVVFVVVMCVWLAYQMANQ